MRVGNVPKTDRHISIPRACILGTRLLADRQLDATLPLQQGEQVLVEDDDEIPEYLKALQAGDKVGREDNFGPEDVVWTGEDRKLDPDEILAEGGRDPTPPLQLLLAALIRGHTSNATENEITSRLRKALAAITGEPSSGRPPVDHHDALLEIAWRYHVARYESLPDGKVDLRPIVTAVVDEFFSDVPTRRNITTQSYVEKLEDKFNAERDLLLVRATMDHDWNRMDDIKKLKRALTILEELGIPVDLSVARPRRRPHQVLTPKDETPGG
jgi:hypothetical protein